MTFLYEKYFQANAHVLFHAFSLNMNHFMQRLRIILLLKIEIMKEELERKRKEQP